MLTVQTPVASLWPSKRARDAALEVTPWDVSWCRRSRSHRGDRGASDAMDHPEEGFPAVPVDQGKGTMAEVVGEEAVRHAWAAFERGGCCDEHLEACWLKAL